MEFISWLINEFRPRLAPQNGLQPLSKEAVKKMEKAAMTQKQALTDEKDSVFMTQEQKDNFNSVGMDQPNNGDSFKQAELIPISHTDVHKFIQEISGDNLQLINFTNEEIEAKDALTSQNNEEFELLQKQIV